MKTSAENKYISLSVFYQQQLLTSLLNESWHFEFPQASKVSYSTSYFKVEQETYFLFKRFNDRFYYISRMNKNQHQEPNQIQMSIFTFTHDYYIQQLPPPTHPAFYRSFPIYKDLLNYKGQPIRVAPVVRIYGTNQCGQKCCCHVHGYFPFLYIKAQQYQDAMKDPIFLMGFLSKLETAYQQALKTDKAIIFKGELQYKFDFYGYHTRKQAFLKIYIFDPSFVTRMRELLNSKILGNKSFQCYEAHINYYMQFFSDFNIYGINQMKVCGFTFRKNLKIMPLFEKISSELNEGIVHTGWDLMHLEETRPECFNCLHKMSNCYIEIDFDFHSILNAYEVKESEDQGDFESSNEEVIVKTEGLRVVKVSITKALQEIWRDQKKRRSRYKIRKTLEGVIDLSKNVECTPQVQNGLRDPLWINFISKGQNGSDFIKMIQSFSLSNQLVQKDELQVDFGSCYNYQHTLTQQRQDLIEKVHSRYRYYESRKNRIIGEIKSGERGELPQWSDDDASQKSDNESQNSDDSVGSEKASQLTFKHSQVMSKGNPSESMGNTVKYRNNFKFQMSNFQKDSLFSSCRFCRQKRYNCECVICQICGEQTCFCLKAEPEDKDPMNIQYQIEEFQYSKDPPSLQEVKAGITVEFQRPFYSKLQDLYQHYKIGNTIPLDHTLSQYIDNQLKNTKFFNRQPITISKIKKLPYFYEYCKNVSSKQFCPVTYELEYSKSPPSCAEVSESIYKKSKKPTNRTASSNKYEDTFVSDLIILNYELLVEIQENKLHYGNPENHPIYAIVFQIYNEKAPQQSIRAVIITEKYANNLTDLFLFEEVLMVQSQVDLLSLFINIVFRVDVDIFMSWDMEKKGVRYLLQRGIINGINLAACLSRVNDLQDIFEHINFTNFTSIKQTYLKKQYLTHGNVRQLATRNPNKDNTYFLNILNQKIKKGLQKKPVLRQKYTFDVQIKGRININLSRLCQQLKLTSYSLQYVVKHLFQSQLSQFTDKQLNMTAKESPTSSIQYLLSRIQFQKLITHQLNFIGGIVEKSKVYGADFLSMMERGTQFKIESIMCRTTKQNDYLTLSATKVQVANQSLLECRPLVLEPPKQFYTEPVLLFDFQSLYPSVMIAYNLCYSTCLGSIKEIFKGGKRKKLGVNQQMTIHLDSISQLIQSGKSEEQLIEQLSSSIFIAPNKVAFVRKNLKQGFIPKILLQFLISRIMIKNSSKLYHNKSIKNLLKERQMALKLFMNVLFGYTGATFSGRMPCSQIADSVVEISKYCLRKSIDYLNNHPIYHGKVIYGDTDSMFFHMPTYSLGQAFQIGKILSNELTKLFPYPMEMKFEKVYESLFLVSKKRYYGKSYQTAESGPKYQGKGVQTVRRDGIPFVCNAMTRILNQIIDSKDLTRVKEMLFFQSKQLLNGKVSLNELSLAKEVKMLKYSPKYLPAHAEAAKRLENIDPMLVPRYGERLKYVIVQGVGALKNRAIPVFEYMLEKNRFKLDLDYYYNKLFMPPLRRTLISLINLDQWGTLNHFNKINQESDDTDQNSHKFHKVAKKDIICQQCLQQQMNDLSSRLQSSETTCRQCVGEKGLNIEHCIEWNCNNLYKRRNASQEWNVAKEKIAQIRSIIKIIDS